MARSTDSNRSQVATLAEGEPRSGSTLAFFFREAFRRLWVSRRISTVAMLMITISLFVVGMFLLLSENLARAVDKWQGKSHVTVYLDVDATPETIQAVDAQLAARTTLERRRFVSKDEARAKFKTFFSDISGVVDQMDQNPFPPSFEVEVSPEVTSSKTFDQEINAVRRLPGVDDIQFDWEWATKVRSLVGVVDAVGLLIGGILALAAAFTIANVTRLTMVLYREEIEIMRLVGATETMVRGPFIVEGLLLGTLGGGLAVALLYGGFVAAQRLINPSNALLLQFLFLTFLPLQKVLALVGGGTASGLIGSWLSLREQREGRRAE